MEDIPEEDMAEAVKLGKFVSYSQRSNEVRCRNIEPKIRMSALNSSRKSQNPLHSAPRLRRPSHISYPSSIHLHGESLSDEN